MRHYFTAVGLALLATAAQAQPNSLVEKNKVGNVEIYTSNYGIIGLNLANLSGSFNYPRGTGPSYIFGAGLWFGAEKRVDGELTSLTFLTYDPNKGTSWATPGEYRTTENPAFPYIYNSADFDRTAGTYTGGQDRPGWPLWLSPGTHASAMLPGTFEPSDAQRSTQAGTHSGPAFVAGADEQIVTRFHDRSLSQYDATERPRKGFPLGLQIQQNVFGWAQGAYQSTVLVQYQIVNMSVDTLFSCVAAHMADVDMGQTDNDHARLFNERPELRAAYAWTQSESRPYQVMGMSLIEAPVTDSRGFIDNSRRGAYRVQGRVGSFQRWQIEEDPSTSAQRYDFITSPSDTVDYGPGDIRAVLASSRFSMRPRDTAYFTVAYMVVDAPPTAGTPANPSTLERLITRITADYYEHGMFSSVASAPAAPETKNGISLTALPNPASEEATIRIALSMDADASLRIVNTLGQEALRRELGTRGAGTYDERIDVGALSPGIYMAVVEAEGKASMTRFVVAR